MIMVMQTTHWGLVFNYAGVFIGVLCIVWILVSLRSIGGKIAQPMYFMLFGVLLQVTAFIYTLFFSLYKIYPAPSIDFHHGIMTLGMLFFIVSAKKFSDLAK